MNLQQALLLVRRKYYEEHKGDTTGPMASEYREACDQYPATMTTAHHLWATELTKNMA